MTARYELVVDVLGFYAVPEGGTDVQRCEIEGRGNVFTDLPAEAIERGLETGTLVKVSGKKTPETPAEGDGEAEWPSTHKDLDALAKSLEVEFPKKANVAAKTEILAAAKAAAEVPAEPETPAEGDGDGEAPADGE